MPYLFLCVLVTACSIKRTEAQINRYRPTRATVSPYLNLRQGPANSGRLPSYYALVRPIQIQRAETRRTQTTLRIQSLELEQMRRAKRRPPFAKSLLPKDLVAPTGKAAQFMTSSRRYSFRDTRHFYPTAGTNR